MQSQFYRLPSEIIENIYDFADKKAELKKYFQRNVLTKVDPTLCFLSNKHCNYCFVRECEIRNGQKSLSDICFGCRQIRNGDVMVSAHDAKKQWRPEYKILVLFGPEHWKRAMFYWVPCQYTFTSSDKCNPINDCLNDMFHRRIINNANNVVAKARNVGLM